MSAITTTLIDEYDITPKMSSELSQYTPNFLKTLQMIERETKHKDGFEKEVKAIAKTLANSAKNVTAVSSLLLRLRRELSNLNAPKKIVEATKLPDIPQKCIEAFERIDYPDEFTLESVRERLDAYDIKTSPNYLALADVMIMLCLRPAEITTLCITDEGFLGYVKGSTRYSKKIHISMGKNKEQAKELLTWIQDTIASGKIGNPRKPDVKCFNMYLKPYGLLPKHLHKLRAVYGAVIHEAKNPAHFMTISGQCLRHAPTNNVSPVQN
nr:3346_t:CDS:2 [Entrophospora candida]